MQKPYIKMLYHKTAYFSTVFARRKKLENFKRLKKTKANFKFDEGKGFLY
jgi:hypothetical protein